MGGCRCAQCWGLAEFMAEMNSKDYGLPASPGHAPALLEAIQGERCTGELTCSCPACDLIARQRRLAHELVPAARQPWETAA